MNSNSKWLADAILPWYERHGRHSLPWKDSPDAYQIWVSEIMLQQTQVSTVIPYFRRFIETFPDVFRLADADEDAVLALWEGLGYYTRARNMRRAARQIVEEFGGAMPSDLEHLMALPGIGRSTAGAIATMAFEHRAPILDGNVKRVLTRIHGIERWPGERNVERQLWRVADELTPEERVGEYTQAIMDLGSTICTRKRPQCSLCPVAHRCIARAHGKTAEIPAPRPRKPMPLQTRQVLIVEDSNGNVLLNKRPPTGVWSGLWSFPELEPAIPARPAVARLLGIPGRHLSRARQLPEIRHQFTHYRLLLKPIHFKLTSSQPPCISDGQLAWFDSATARTVGLAAPVRRLMSSWVSSNDDEDQVIADG